MKLHELLAVENNLETQATKTRTDLANTFEKKRHLFEEKRVIFTPMEENAKAVVEAQSDIQSSIQKELNWFSGFFAKALDASYKVAETNMSARANIILEDGGVLAESVPATALLELEKRMAELLTLVQTIPTLDPAKGFSPDDQRGEGYFQARTVRKSRTKKDKVVLVLYPATEQHPAQTQLIDKDVNIGAIEEQEWSSLLTPASKADLINRVEIVARAVRQARSRANEQEVPKVQIANALLNYIFGKK